MPRSLQLTQLARLLARPDLAESSPDAARVREAVEGGIERLAHGLLEEASASDDVIDAASADVFIEDRLAFFGELLTDGQRSRLRDSCRRVTGEWG